MTEMTTVEESEFMEKTIDQNMTQQKLQYILISFMNLMNLRLHLV